MKRVLIAEEISPQGLSALEAAGFEVAVRLGLTAEELKSEVANYEALIVRSATKVGADVIEVGTKLEVIGRAGAGVDNVDIASATARGILVANAPESNIVSAAEHAMALILALARRVPEAHASLTSGKWERSKLEGTEIYDKTIGIVGLGRIGTLVAQRCLAFGMKVIASDPHVSENRAAQLSVRLVEFDELLAQADVISIHVPKSAENMGLINAASLQKCKRGVKIVNVSRGGLVNETDLAQAITDGIVSGAALDVFETEPQTSSPLFGMSQVVVTPHLAGSTSEASVKAGVVIAEQVILALRGEFVPHAVNLQAGGNLQEWMRPYMSLAGKLGRLACALGAENAESFEAHYAGRLANEDTRAITLSALKGFLEPTAHDPVTYVNAPGVSENRGLSWGESKSSEQCDYANLVTVKVKRRNDEIVTASGTLFGRNDEPRLVEVDGRPLELALTGFLALFRYTDRPGVVHKITGPLADAGVNIRNMVVAESRDEADPQAVMVMSVDAEISPDVLQRALQEAEIKKGRFVNLTD